eukprot:CAMPEP_0119411854 /NCGR_PEP_ID=MMETSP1335-20130426/4457_1 /TAXON_ID=259385 /ORGANISM="Chrysoculter rhomboideus, Strain RCC1486" /LENGTH=218 /DNA_ID=CAMNT_0007436527 /DNA_START=104 /DNA_END=762 /DNA_ORIENTATION=+
MIVDVASSPTRPCVGCPAEVEVNDAVLSAAHWSLGEINRQRNSMYALSFVRVVRATSQVVAGIKYTITFEAGESSCRNDGHAHELSECPLSETARKELHTVEVRAEPLPAMRLARMGTPGLGGGSPDDSLRAAGGRGRVPTFARAGCPSAVAHAAVPAPVTRASGTAMIPEVDGECERDWIALVLSQYLMTTDHLMATLASRPALFNFKHAATLKLID